MKNSSHPLIQAVSKRAKVNDHGFHLSETPRQFQVKKDDMPAKKKMYPGDKAKFMLHGKVSSVHDDGTMMMNVEKVEHQDEGQPEDNSSGPAVA